MSDYTELCARLRAFTTTGGRLNFSDTEEAADAIEAQAREIAELRAQLAKLDEKLSCGHRKLDHDDSYGGCTFCGFANGYHEYERDNDKLEAERDALRARAEAAEKAIKEHNDGCVAACEARQRGDYGQDCSAWISRKKQCLDCARDSMIDYPAAIAAGGSDAKD